MKLSEVEKEAIELLKEFKKNGFHLLNFKYESRVRTTKIIENSIETVFNLIEKQQKELDKKDKIINLMVEHIEKGCDFDSRIQTKQQILDYFTKEVEEENG